MAVYFVEEVNTGNIKIGFTDTPMECRLRGLQNGNSSALRVLGVPPAGTRTDESNLHTEFRKFWMRGEWYRGEEPLRGHLSRETPQYPRIRRIDTLAGSTATRTWLLKLRPWEVEENPSRCDYFDWEKTFERVEEQLRRGVARDRVVAAPLDRTPVVQYFGFFRTGARKSRRERIHALWERDHRLCMSSIHLKRGGLPFELRRLANTAPQTFSALEEAWKRAMAEWFSETNRLYL